MSSYRLSDNRSGGYRCKPSTARGRAWWAGLDSDQRAAYVERKSAERSAEAEANPSPEWCWAVAALDVANSLGIFMREVEPGQLAERIRATYPQCVKHLDTPRFKRCFGRAA